MLITENYLRKVILEEKRKLMIEARPWDVINEIADKYSKIKKLKEGPRIIRKQNAAAAQDPAGATTDPSNAVTQVPAPSKVTPSDPAKAVTQIVQLDPNDLTPEDEQELNSSAQSLENFAKEAEKDPKKKSFLQSPKFIKAVSILAAAGLLASLPFLSKSKPADVAPEIVDTTPQVDKHRPRPKSHEKSKKVKRAKDKLEKSNDVMSASQATPELHPTQIAVNNSSLKYKTKVAINHYFNYIQMPNDIKINLKSGTKTLSLAKFIDNGIKYAESQTKKPVDLAFFDYLKGWLMTVKDDNGKVTPNNQAALNLLGKAASDAGITFEIPGYGR